MLLGMESNRLASEMDAGDMIDLFGEKAFVTDAFTYQGVYGVTTELTYAYVDSLGVLSVVSTMRISGTASIPLWKD